MNSIKKNLMNQEYDAPSMPIQTLNALKQDDRIVVCQNIDEYLEYLEEWFVNENDVYGYTDHNFDLEDADCFGTFNDFIRGHKTGVLKCNNNIYWIVDFSDYM
jgi:hypothetical protein